VRAVTDSLAKCRLRRGYRGRFHFRPANGDASALEIVTEPYPGFPTDMQGANVRVAFDEQRNEFSY